MDIINKYTDGTIYGVELHDLIPYDDWCIVKKSQEFHNFIKLLDSLSTKQTSEVLPRYMFLCDRKSCEKCMMSRCDDFDGPDHCKSIYTDNPECAKNFYLEERCVKEFGGEHYFEKYRLSEDKDNSDVDLSALVIATIALIIAIAGLVIRFI